MRINLTAVSVAAVALGIYVLTLAPTVTLVDSGELIVAAWTAGVAHPPGFPLYTMLAHLATRVPVGEIAARVNFASALFGALAAGATSLAAVEVARSRVVTRLAAPRKNEAAAVDSFDPAAAVLAAVAGGSMLAFSRAFWSFATIAEVYTLNTLMVALVAFVVLRWRAEALAGRRRDALLIVAAVLFGLALGVHHVTVLVWVPGLAFLVWRTAPRPGVQRRDALRIALAGIAGLAVYAYLPIAASRGPLMNWGDPDSANRLFLHVSGWIYQANLASSQAGFGEQIAEFLRIAVRQYGPWWLPAGFALVVAGIVRLWRRDRTLLGALALVAGSATAYALAYDIAEDTEAYYLPVFIVFALVAGTGAAELLELARRFGRPYLAPIAVGLVVAVALAGNLPYTNRRGDFIARDYVHNAFATIEPGGMLLTEDWQLYSPMLYTIEVAGERTDVVAIDVNLLRRSWYVESMMARYPSHFAAAEPDVTVYLQDLRGWEADPDAYARDGRLSERIDGRFRGMILALVSAHARVAPVYVTQELVVSDSGLSRAIGATWQAVPHGLVFRLYSDTAFHEPPDIALETRSLTGGSRRTEPDDVVELKVRPVYSGMLVNRGLYLAVHGRHDQALESANAALAIDPGSADARRLATQLASRPPS